MNLVACMIDDLSQMLELTNCPSTNYHRPVPLILLIDMEILNHEYIFVAQDSQVIDIVLRWPCKYYNTK